MPAPSGLRPRQALVAVLVGGVVGQVAAALVLQLSLALEIRRTDAAPEAVPELLASLTVLAPSMLTSSAVLLITALLTPLLLGHSPLASLGLRTGAPPSMFLAAGLGTLGLAPLADLFMRFMERLWPEATFGTLQALHELAATAPFLALWPLLALMPGLGEEFLFRGLLQRSIRPGAKAVVVSGVAFALFHVDPHHVAGVLPLGLFLAWSAAVAGSIWVAVFAHVLNNTASMVAARVEALDVGYGTPDPMPWSWVPLGLAVAALCAWWMLRTRHAVGHGSEA